MEHFPSDLLKPVEIIKNHNSFWESLAVKAMCFTQNLSYSNPKEEVSSYNIDEFMATYLCFKTKMGIAGWIFEPHPSNFEILYNFLRCSNDVYEWEILEKSWILNYKHTLILQTLQHLLVYCTLLRTVRTERKIKALIQVPIPLFRTSKILIF